jgi:hypothetical protein
VHGRQPMIEVSDRFNVWTGLKVNNSNDSSGNRIASESVSLCYCDDVRTCTEVIDIFLRQLPLLGTKIVLTNPVTTTRSN